MTRIYHQLGHRYKWSIESLLEEGTGDGAIIPARYMERAKVSSLPEALRAQSIFDPQFFLPGSAQGALPTYPFFPQVIAGGFSTTDWDAALAGECARQCLAFQVESGFQSLVIPTRFREGMPADFINSQEASFVTPFLSAYQALGLSQPLLLQVVLTDQMLKDPSYRRDILNWITAIPAISGIYLIIHVPNRRKQISDIDLLLAMLSVVRSVKTAGMQIVLGYLNTEAVLLLAGDPDVVTIGSYENLRMFGTLPYEEDQDGKRRGPNPRFYVSRLLQWIEHQYVGAIARVVENPSEYFDETPYRITLFEPTYKWHFTKPEPYRHYFHAASRQLRRLAAIAPSDRPPAIASELEAAMAQYQFLKGRGIVFDEESSGNHIPAWLTALNLHLQGAQ